MDHGGKDYRSYRAKNFTQFIERKRMQQIIENKRLQQKTTKSQIMLFMRKSRDSRKTNHCFFQAALKVLFLSPQMSARKGIKEFGERAIAAMIKEFTQLDQGAFPGKPVVEPVDYSTLTEEEKAMAMDAINLIKEKRGGTVKGRTCANGSKQRKYLKEDESVASPTVSNEGIIGTFMMDAYEELEVGIFDIPGAYLHAKMEHKKDHRILLVLQYKFVDMMCDVNPKYLPFVQIINGRKVLYLKILRALYGCIESALLWYQLFSSTLVSMGFEINPYDQCVANKTIDGEQCTITWYVDDAKILHKSKKVVTGVFNEIQKHFGEMDITYGDTHKYLGMKICIKNKKVTIDMRDQINELINFFDDNISGTVASPANKNLMNVDPDSKLLCSKKRENFHSTTAKLLYLVKRARPDMELVTTFMTSRVSNPTEEDWRKLTRALTFLQQTCDDLRVIGCENLESVYTWIDAAYAVHPNMRSQTGGTFSMGWGSIHSKSSKQKLNTKSSTESELVGMSDYLPYNIWWINFLGAQGYKVTNNVIYQDNQSAIRMEKNGRNSCTGNSRHIDIRYFL